MKYFVKVTCVTLFFLFMFTSCGTQKNVIKNQTVAIDYARDHNTAGLKELLKEYRTLVRSLDKGEKPLPSIYAEYALLLFRNGDLKNAEKMMEIEIKHYPEAKIYLEKAIKK